MSTVLWLALGAPGWAACGVAVARLRERAELAARAAHELRTPLTAARLALERVPGGDAAAALDLELRRASLALDDLELARHGRHAGDVAEPAALDELLASVAVSWGPTATRLATRIDVGEAPVAYVLGDRVRLVQALGNLVGNALEHGAGPVGVRAVLGPGAVRFEVSDAGPGLPAPVAELIGRARAGRGRRGRGLAIAAEIARRHGGRVSAAPVARGAKLVLELPVLALPEARRAEERPS
jgi:signal transduction histidine kinase